MQLMKFGRAGGRRNRELALWLVSLVLMLLLLTGCGAGQYDGELQADDNPGTVVLPELPDAADSACLAELQRFNQDAWQPVLFPGCVNCHQSTGIAADTALVFAPGSDATQLQQNLSQLNRYLLTAGQQTLLDKPLANIVHGGGQVFAPQSAAHQTLLSWLNAAPASCDDVVAPQPSPFWQHSINASAGDTLRKAALLFAGRLPTSTELAAVNNGDETVLRQHIRALMRGEHFADFLRESVNDRLLTNKFANNRTPALDLIYQGGRFPYVESRLAPLQAAIDNASTDAERDTARQAFSRVWNHTNQALAQAPLELVNFIVQRDRPYTEVLTADYLMVNPYSAAVYHSGVAFSDINDPDEWHPARISDGYSLGPLPHAGLLSSQMFLARYPSTDTNRNRARSRWAYYFFLGLDIEGLAIRSMDPEALADNNNPTLHNPACSGCHSVMDPVAGAFQNWGDNGHYRDAWDGDDSLPDSYKNSTLYQPGDLWYRDMRTPGFNGRTLPPEHRDNSLQWLAQQLTEDPRFATGTVSFWWPAVFAAQLLTQPTETNDAGYDRQLRLYNEQQRLVSELGQRFAQGLAGTASHGRYNLKDLLVDMAMTPVFRAAGTDGNVVSAGDMGQGQLLTAEQLNRKINAISGYRWHHSWDDERELLTTDFYAIYGGIDSDTVVQRGGQLNTMMAAVANRLSQEMVCQTVLQEFQRPRDERWLFTLVEMTDTAANNRTLIQQQVNRLLAMIWGNSRTDLALEQSEAFNLWQEVWQSRQATAASSYLYHNDETNDDNDEYCRLDWDNADNPDNPAIVRDPNHTLRSWMALLSYLLSDFVVLYE